MLALSVIVRWSAGSRLFLDVRKQYRGAVFIVDPQVISAAYQQLNALLPHVEIYYMLKANYHPSVVEEVIAAGCGVVVSTATELAMVKDVACDVRFGIAGPHIERALLNDASFQCRYVSVNSAAAARDLGESRFSGEILLRVAAHNFTPRKFGCTDPAELSRLLSDLGMVANGLHVHVGTNIEEPSVWRNALGTVPVEDLPLRNVGGGLPPPSWLNEAGLSLSDYVTAFDSSWSLIEPGRYLVADCTVCVCRVLGVDGSRVFIDVASNALPPLGSTRYVVSALIRAAEVALPDPRGQEFHIFDNGCMDILYLPSWTAEVPPEKGDLLVIGRCGAYTYSLWSEFGESKPPTIVRRNVL